MILWINLQMPNGTPNWITGAEWWKPPLPHDHDLVAAAWADTLTRYHIPRHYALQLIDGVARDLSQSRYQTFDELATYCYGVASTVG